MHVSRSQSLNRNEQMSAFSMVMMREEVAVRVKTDCARACRCRGCKPDGSDSKVTWWERLQRSTLCKASVGVGAGMLHTRCRHAHSQSIFERRDSGGGRSRVYIHLWPSVGRMDFSACNDVENSDRTEATSEFTGTLSWRDFWNNFDTRKACIEVLPTSGRFEIIYCTTLVRLLVRRRAFYLFRQTSWDGHYFFQKYTVSGFPDLLSDPLSRCHQKFVWNEQCSLSRINKCKWFICSHRQLDLSLTSIFHLHQRDWLFGAEWISSTSTVQYSTVQYYNVGLDRNSQYDPTPPSCEIREGWSPGLVVVGANVGTKLLTYKEDN